MTTGDPASTNVEPAQAATAADVDEPELTVNDYLDMALAAAAEQEVSTSELLGTFFYYAHSIAESHRHDAIDAVNG